MDAQTSSTIEPQTMYDYINGILMNPGIFIILIIVVLAYVIIFVSLGKPSSNNYTTYSNNSGTDGSTSILIFIIISVFVVLILFNILQYFFSIDIVASIKNLFKPKPELDIVVNRNTNLKNDNNVDSIHDYLSKINSSDVNSADDNKDVKYGGEQVFNIPGNYYNYDDAKTLCKAYGARLATYDEIEKSYNKGGEWCNYGWSDGQMALFPTQKNTFDTLQKIKGHENDCGRTGVNGGYIANQNVQFGVNCYGNKPQITSQEEEMMKNMKLYPESLEDIEMDKKLEYWKSKINDILVSPFNHNTWSKV